MTCSCCYHFWLIDAYSHLYLAARTAAGAAAAPSEAANEDNSYDSAEDDDYDPDSADNESEEEAEDDDNSDDEDSVDSTEVEDLEAQANMPPKSAKKKSKSPKKSAAADDEVAALTSRASRLSIKDAPRYNVSWGMMPYVIYSFNDEDNPVRHMWVELLIPNLPAGFIRDISVSECGTKLNVLIGAPKWFFDTRFLERKMGHDYHVQHSGVEDFEMQVVQKVREKYELRDAWVTGDPFVIRLPETCYSGAVQWQRGTWQTAGMDVVDLNEQYQWVVTCMLKTKKEFIGGVEIQGFATYHAQPM